MTEVAISAENNSTSLATDGGAIPDVVAQHSSDDNLYHGTNDAANEGILIVEGLRSGPLATIDAGVKALESTAKFRGNIEAMTAFMGPLVEAKILSPSEARLGPASPKLSRLCKIGEYAHRLRHEQIIRYFLETGCSGHTLIYQTAVLLDQIPDDQGDDERIQQLVETLRREQVNTRQGMLRLTKEMKDAKRGLGASPPTFVGASADESVSVDGVPTIHLGRDFDLVLSTPRRSDIRKLREDYYGPLPRCLRTGETVADDAVMIVVAALSDFPVIENKFLPFCGLESISPRLFLSQSPAGPEVTGAQAIIVAELGSSGRAHLAEIEWLTNDEPIDPLVLAARLVPDAKNKLNLFASAEADGWQSLIGDANWSQVDD
jgi:hypothetical protein